VESAKRLSEEDDELEKKFMSDEISKVELGRKYLTLIGPLSPKVGDPNEDNSKLNVSKPVLSNEKIREIRYCFHKASYFSIIY